MKKASLVWRFFERVTDENQRTVSVLCQLCDTHYKYFGNTTNLKSHLVRKHPLQWELLNTGSLDETARRRIENADDEESTPSRKRIYHVGKNLDADGQDYNDQESEDQNASIQLVQQLHGNGSDEEWLEEDPFQTSVNNAYQPKSKKAKSLKIKREVESPPTRRLSYYHSMSPPSMRKSLPQRPIIIKDTTTRDEYSVFGEYVANKIRKCQTAKTRGNIQQLITTILWQAEYGLYDDPASVKHVLMLHNDKPAEKVATTVEVQELETTSDQIIETEVYS